MIYDLAVRILSARSGARVNTSIPCTRFVGGTVGIMNAFGSASLVGIASIVRQTGT
jgi:hypothetical protein